MLLNPLQAAGTRKVLLKQNYINQAFWPHRCMLLLLGHCVVKKGQLVPLKFASFLKLIATYQPKSDDLSEEGA